MKMIILPKNCLRYFFLQTKLSKVMSFGAPENEYVLKWTECVIKSLSRVSKVDNYCRLLSSIWFSAWRIRYRIKYSMPTWIVKVYVMVKEVIPANLCLKWVCLVLGENHVATHVRNILDLQYCPVKSKEEKSLPQSGKY
ncbi:Guanylate-Binding Protein 4 [Manis pentadactyla]|nr:Guanylate-Binding Protein 4 [Manis pentadactyla]